jgi:hypothetical protein
MQLTNVKRKAKIITSEEKNSGVVVEKSKEKFNRNEVIQEIKNFKDIICNQVLMELLQYKQINNLQLSEKKEIRNKVEFIVDNNFNNLVERVFKKL